MPNMMSALPNIGGPSVKHHEVWLTLTTEVPCSIAAKKQNPLTLAVVPQTTELILAANGPQFTILWEHAGEILLFNRFFFRIVDTCLSCKDVARQSRAILRRWRIFGDILHPTFPASRVQHIPDLHSKFTLRPHHVWKYGRHPICGRWD